MALTQWRAFRFEMERDSEGLERRPVGLRVTPHGTLAMVTDAAAVRQGLMLLLCTMPGERVMRPDYGCDLFRLVFSPNDETTAGLAVHYVRSAIEKWEPRVRLLRVDAAADPSRDGVLGIFVEYEVRSSLHVDWVELDLRLDGGGF